MNVEVAKRLRCRQTGGGLAGAAYNPDEVQSIGPTADKPPHVKCRVQKVESGRLSKLGRWILLNTGDGLERGEIAEGYWSIERRYCGWYTNPCLTPKEKRAHERQYRRVQPLVSKTLKKLQELGLVKLIRYQRYVKKIALTPEGKLLVRQLTSIGGANVDGG